MNAQLDVWQRQMIIGWINKWMNIYWWTDQRMDAWINIWMGRWIDETNYGKIDRKQVWKNSNQMIKTLINWTHGQIHICMYVRKEGYVLFNKALNTFCLWLYGVSYMVKDHSDSKWGNPLLPLLGELFLIRCKGSFICIFPQIGQHIPWPLLPQWWNTECW